MSNETEPKKVVVGPNFLDHWYFYDYQRCADESEFRQTLGYINRHGYDVISVSQNGIGEYTVVFRCRACG